MVMVAGAGGAEEPKATSHPSGGGPDITIEPNRPGRPDTTAAAGPIAGAAVALAAAAALVYARAIAAGFYSDDYTWLARMPATLRHPPYVFTVFFRDFNPLLHASFALDYLAGHGGAAAYHATSIVVHAACAGLLALLCRRLGAGPWVAAAAALTWALNVRISEAVIWPAARGHSLATLFTLAACLCLAGAGRWRVWRATALFAAALLSKETAFFPMLVAPLIASSLPPATPIVPAPAAGLGGAAERRWHEFLPLAALGAVFLVFNQIAKPSFHYSVATTGDLFRRLPFILLRPVGLGDYYDFGYPAAVAVLAALCGVTFVLRRTPALAGFLWIAACSVPIVPLYRYSSRYLYLLSVGYALVLCGLAGWVSRRMAGRDLRRAAGWLAGVALLLIAAANVIRIQREIDDYALLSRPYADCLRTLRKPIDDLGSDETLVVVDVSPRDAVERMTRLMDERGNITKLIPYRPGAIGGLIELSDAINIVRAGEEGFFGIPVLSESASRHRTWVYDGGQAVESVEVPAVPDDRRFATRLGTLDEYLAAGAEVDP
jgi:hypothetical protein